jgi:hypothetical protein
VQCLKLDATPLGKNVYDSLGFRDEWTLSRWVHAGLPAHPGPSDAGAIGWPGADQRGIDQLDASVFGVSRGRMLQALAQQSRRALVLGSERSAVAGYGLLRDGVRALYLGPVAAATADAGVRLIEMLLGQAGGATVFWDIPDPNRVAVDWAQDHGFAMQRSLTRMVLGVNRTPGDPTKQFALAGPEMG